MSPMMASVQLEGICESGFGVTLAGFHAPTLDVPKKIAELKSDAEWDVLAQCESNGYVTFIACKNQNLSSLPKKFALLRREPHRLFLDLSPLLRKLRVSTVKDMVLTESYGSITLTFLYTEAGEGPSA